MASQGVLTALKVMREIFVEGEELLSVEKLNLLVIMYQC